MWWKKSLRCTNIDIPDGPKAGELVKFKGESRFKLGDRIISIEDTVREDLWVRYV